ncbi:MAG: hypothetical protein ABW141_05140 [Candidatus Thiodiazotropha endolucinida]
MWESGDIKRVDDEAWPHHSRLSGSMAVQACMDIRLHYFFQSLAQVIDSITRYDGNSAKMITGGGQTGEA